MSKRTAHIIATAAVAAFAAIAAPAQAQTKSAADSIAEYREMLADGNPAELYEA